MFYILRNIYFLFQVILSLNSQNKLLAFFIRRNVTCLLKHLNMCYI